MSSTGASLERPDWLAIAGVVLVVVSMPLDYLTADEAVIGVNGALQSSMSGLEAPDAQLILVSVVVLMLVTAVGRYRAGGWGYLAVIPTALAGLLTAGLTLIYINDPATGATGTPEVLAQISTGLGTYVAFAGGLVLLAGAVIGYRTPTEETTPDPAAVETDEPSDADET